MKTILFSTFLLLIYFNDFAQIYSSNSNQGAIEITPNGIKGKSNSLNFQTISNTALGNTVMTNASNVMNNTAIGNFALIGLTVNTPNTSEGNNNTAVGSNVLSFNTQGFNNAAMGEYAMYGGIEVAGNNNAAFGRYALSYISTGSNNAAFGLSALFNNNAGNHNSAFGTSAMAANNNSNYHSSFGWNSSQNHKTGDGNTTFGTSSMFADQSGINSTAFGSSALSNNISGNANTTFGTSSMYSNKVGNSNVALGYTSLFKNDGNSNTVVGSSALKVNTTGSNNIAIGVNTLIQNITGSGNITLGMNSGFSELGSNKLYINIYQGILQLIGGDFSARKVGIVTNMTGNGVNDFNTRTEAFQVSGEAFKTLGSGNWIIPSDRRLKTNIVSLKSDEILGKVLQIQGVSYYLRSNPEQGIQTGFIAQDLQKIFPSKVYENKAGYLSASYGAFTPIFVEAVKALDERIEALANQTTIKTMTAQLDKIEEILREK